MKTQISEAKILSVFSSVSSVGWKIFIKNFREESFHRFPRTLVGPSRCISPPALTKPGSGCVKA